MEGDYNALIETVLGTKLIGRITFCFNSRAGLFLGMRITSGAGRFCAEPFNIQHQVNFSNPNSIAKFSIFGQIRSTAVANFKRDKTTRRRS